MQESGPKTILLVEDEAIIAMSEKLALEKYGWVVVTAHSGAKAVELVRESPEIDLVLMDIDLGGGMDGTHAAELILSDRDLPIIFLSSHTDPEVVAKTEKITSYGYVVKNSTATVLDASIKMAFRLYQSRLQEKQQQRKYREFFEHNPAAVAVHEILRDHNGTALDSRFVAVNSAYLELTGLNRAQVEGRTMLEVFPDADFHWIETYAQVAAGAAPLMFETYSTALERHLEEKVFNTGADQYTTICLDISERKRAEIALRDAAGKRRQADTALRDSEARYRMLFNSITDAILLVDRSRIIIDCNPAFTELFGYRREEAQGRTTEFLLQHQRDFRALGDAIRRHSDGSSFYHRVQYRRKNGEIFTGEKRVHYMRNEDGEITGFIGTVRDITEREATEEKIRQLVREKETLLQEVQHHVKNTMNTMDSLLALQADSLKDPSAVAALSDARSRFKSMQVLYDQLYRTDTHGSASVKHYLVQLVTNAIALFPSAETVEVITEIEDFALDARRLSNLGLILNELVTNAMKYAFSGREKAELSVSLRRDRSRATLVVHDNGPGLPQAFDIGSSQGFGMTIVRALAEQLGGTIRFEQDGGTRVVLEIEI